MHNRVIRIGAIAWGMMTLTFLGGNATAEWQPITKDLPSKVKAGYGGLSGVVVDHRTGDVYVNVSDCGIYHSTNQGRSWELLGAEFKGRTEWPGCMMIDPLGEGKRMVVATVYGAPIAHGTTAGQWEFADKKSSHVDWCAVDWSDEKMRFVLALKHESEGLLLVSHDGGKTFAEIGKGHGPAWIFDGDTAVVAQMKTRIVRIRGYCAPRTAARRLSHAAPMWPMRCRAGTTANSTGWWKGRS